MFGIKYLTFNLKEYTSKIYVYEYELESDPFPFKIKRWDQILRQRYIEEEKETEKQRERYLKLDREKRDAPENKEGRKNRRKEWDGGCM